MAERPEFGLHSVHINRIDGTVRVENLATDEAGVYRIDGTVRVENLATDEAGVYRIDGTEFVTESITLEVV